MPTSLKTTKNDIIYIEMENIREIKIKDEYINLAQFLKIADLINSGGEAKIYLQNNKILINGQLDDRRGRKLYKNDLIEINGKRYKIC